MLLLRHLSTTSLSSNCYWPVRTHWTDCRRAVTGPPLYIIFQRAALYPRTYICMYVCIFPHSHTAHALVDVNSSCSGYKTITSSCTNYSGNRSPCRGEQPPGWNLLNSRDNEKTIVHVPQERPFFADFKNSFSWISMTLQKLLNKCRTFHPGGCGCKNTGKVKILEIM